MGFNTYIPSSDDLVKRSRDHEKLFNSIHRARVVEIHINEGTVKVALEKVSYSAVVTFPLLGLSVPQVSGDTTVSSNFKQASWGRYIPQVGDVLLVGFDSAGNLHAFGYSAVFYKSFDIADADQESKGGIGWGETSGKTVKSGDWDFKSARDSSLYLGDKAVLGSGPYSISVDKPGGNITVSTPLLIGSIGNSRTYAGVAKRRMLPVDPEESYVYTLRPSPLSGLEIAQEFAIKARWNGGSPLGQELVTWSIGDVIDDAAPVPMLAVNLNATPPQTLRWYFNSTDTTGYLPAYTEFVDTLGNYGCTSLTAMSFSWTTLLASWEIKNLKHSVTALESISHTSTTSFDVVAGTEVNLTAGSQIKALAGVGIDLSGTASAALYATGGMTSLGAPSGGAALILSPAMKLALSNMSASVASLSAAASTAFLTIYTPAIATATGLMTGPAAPAVGGFSAVTAMFTALDASITSLSAAMSALAAAIAQPTASTAKTLAV